MSTELLQVATRPAWGRSYKHLALSKMQEHLRVSQSTAGCQEQSVAVSAPRGKLYLCSSEVDWVVRYLISLSFSWFLATFSRVPQRTFVDFFEAEAEAEEPQEAGHGVCMGLEVRGRCVKQRICF